TVRQGNADASRPQAAHAASSVETPQANESARWPAGPEEVRVARQQWLIFASGQRLSRELFRELSHPDGPSELDAFKAFMDASMALGGRRAGMLSTISASTPPDPVELLSLWLEAHALGHLALLAFRGDRAWFSDLVRELRLAHWTPTHAVTCERIMSVALRGAFATGRLGPAAL